MIRSLLSALAALAVLGLVAAAPLHAESQLDQEIKQMEQAEAEALLKGNVDALTKMWADGYMASVPGGRVRTRQEMVQAVRSEALKYTTLVREPQQIGDYGDTVVVIGREKVVTLGKDRTPGEPVTRQYLNVWVKHDGRWRLVATQSVVPAGPAS